MDLNDLEHLESKTEALLQTCLRLKQENVEQRQRELKLIQTHQQLTNQQHLVITKIKALIEQLKVLERAS